MKEWLSKNQCILVPVAMIGFLVGLIVIGISNYNRDERRALQDTERKILDGIQGRVADHEAQRWYFYLGGAPLEKFGTHMPNNIMYTRNPAIAAMLEPGTRWTVDVHYKDNEYARIMRVIARR